MDKKKICLSEEEILNQPNDNLLGYEVRKKLWNNKSNKKKTWISRLKNFLYRN